MGGSMKSWERMSARGGVEGVSDGMCQRVCD